jgi:hypothetical protein
MPKHIRAFQTSDGQVFTSEKQAIENEDDLIGAELNELFGLFGLRDNIGHQAIYNACVNALKDKKHLKSVCSSIVSIIEFGH